MSYVEIGSILFRGELQGANGVAEFTLTADAIDAVDSINIGFGEVSYLQYVSYNTSKSVVKDSSMLSIVLNLPADYEYVEINAYADGAKAFQMDGKSDHNRYRSHVNDILFSYSSLWKLSGQHNISIVSAITGASSSGWILVKYLRGTGSGYPS